MSTKPEWISKTLAPGGYYVLIEEADEAVASFNAELLRKDAALYLAAEQFRKYEKLHLANVVADVVVGRGAEAFDKANENERMAELCEKALGEAPPEAPSPSSTLHRCKSLQPMTGYRCGLWEGHSDDHTLLIPTGVPWDGSMK